MSRITFIGGGNMATAIAGGLIANGTSPSDIAMVDPNSGRRTHLQETLGVKVFDDATEACSDADVIILAVKPQTVSTVAKQITSKTNLGEKLLISIVAGVTLASLETMFGRMAIVRTMPNTPALIGLGATGLYPNSQTTEAQCAESTRIIEAFGICVTVEREDLLDAITAVSGSGPAYYFLMIEEMIKAGIKLGLSAEDTSKLTIQTALGAARMAAQGEVEPDELRRQVTSPNGTTHAAITSMQDDGYGDMIEKAMVACHDRAIELGKE